jgi:isopentenyl-diphosphate Delta-isomerase
VAKKKLSKAKEDPAAEQRKSDHITLALKSRVHQTAFDARFDYEPLFHAHPSPSDFPAIEFLGKQFRLPIWVSSMTGGTEKAGKINHRLARVCNEFGMGMGLGSCRQLLYSHDHLADFDVRSLIGDQPLYANLGIAQLETLFAEGAEKKITELMHVLQADGLIIHVNPLQEALQPEGDAYLLPPIQTIERVLDQVKVPLIVKEVGQGFGPKSLEALLRLPLDAIEFAAGGGTNFALLELLRSDQIHLDLLSPLAQIGHTAPDMVQMTNSLSKQLGPDCLTKQIIISGGIQTWLDGYHLMKSSNLSAIYGQASAFLPYALESYDQLRAAVAVQAKGLALAHAYAQTK